MFSLPYPFPIPQKVIYCTSVADYEVIGGVSADFAHKYINDHEEDTTDFSFITTWSYQTSSDPTNAGHDSDIFVVPVYYLLIHDVTEVVFNKNDCTGSDHFKIKFDVEMGKGEKAISFLSREGVAGMQEDLDKSINYINEMIFNNTGNETVTDVATQSKQDIEKAKSHWDKILDDYNKTNQFNDPNLLINPSKFYEDVETECTDLGWGESMLCTSMSMHAAKSHWSSLFPAKLFPENLTESEWKEVQDISFSGGGGKAM